MVFMVLFFSVLFMVFLVTPYMKLPFGPRISYLDLALGALSGGAWSSARISLVIVFVIDIIVIISSSLWLVRNKQKT
jgi:hypothetical protein